MAPFLEFEKFKFLFVISFQGFRKEFILETNSKNFVVDESVFFEVEIENSIEFISDVKIEVFEISDNKNLALLNYFNLHKKQNLEIGKIYIPENELSKIKSINKFYIRPNFYTLKKKNKITGKLLANFTLIKSSNKIKEIKSKYLKICQIEKSSFKIKISCIGLRNLTKEISEPKIVYKILKREIILKSELKNTKKNCYNVNICDTEEICLELPNKFIFWPFIEISVFENFVSKKRIYGISLPLVYFCDLISQKFLKDYKEFIGIDFLEEKNFNFSENINGKHFSLINEGFDEEIIHFKDTEKRKSMKFQKEIKNLIINLRKKNQITKTESYLSNTFGPNSEIQESLASLKKNPNLNSINEISDSENSIKNEKKNSKLNIKGFFKENTENFNKSEKSEKNFEEKIQEKNFDPLFCFDFSKRHLNEENFTSYKIKATYKLKNKELEERENMIKTLKQEITKKKSASSNHKDKETQNIINKINDIKKNFVTKEKFIGNLFKKNLKGNKFGRKIENTDFDIKKLLPYKKINLFHFWGNFGDFYTMENNFCNSGKPCQTIIKTEIKVIKNEKPKKVKEKIYFDLFNKKILEIFNEIHYLKVRVYIFRALNLTAQSNINSIKERLAGYEALSSANPYIELKIGFLKRESIFRKFELC